MTVVNQETGELVETIGANRARQLTTEARAEFGSSRDHFEKAWAKIEEAVTGGGHIDLGYRSPGDYLHAEFDGVLSGLDVASRRIAVRTMTDWGLSTRAISGPLGVSNYTVHADQQSPVRDLTPQIPAPESEGEDGDGAGHTPEGEVVAAPSNGVPATAPSGTATPRPPVTGIDGKTYSRPDPKPVKPVMSADEAEYDNAVQASKALARSVSKLLEFQHPNMRVAMREYWSTASIEVPPTPRRDVTPEQMRVAAHGLLTLADEWES